MSASEKRGGGGEGGGGGGGRGGGGGGGGGRNGMKIRGVKFQGGLIDIFEISVTGGLSFL